MSKFNDAWDEVFEQYALLSEIDKFGFCDISAESIKKIYEPRLLTKQDHRNDRPLIFQNNDLNILPLSRLTFRICRVEVFHDFENNWNDASDDIVSVEPCNVDSIDFDNITSEAIAIRSLACTRMLNDFLDVDDLKDTVGGRMKSECFDFKAKNLHSGDTSVISVNNAQIEIDGGYEAHDCLCLIESKLNLATDFNIRQLYYPYRCWSLKVHKQIRPVFFIYNNGIYHVMEYRFDEHDCMNSLHRVKYKRYMIDEENITTDDLNILSKNASTIKEPNVPFPQADSLERIINLCTEMKQRGIPMTKTDIWLFFSFTSRQADYYANAGVYLGLLQKTAEREYFLTTEGMRIFDEHTTLKRRNMMIAGKLMQHGVFNDCFRWSLYHNCVCDKHEFEKIIRKHTECNIGESLYVRRSSTVCHWVKWIMNLIRNHKN